VPGVVRRERLGKRVLGPITTLDGKVSRASGYTLSFFRKQPDSRWLLARDANLLTPEE
jgi:ketosteroid isomerase-like protein